MTVFLKSVSGENLKPNHAPHFFLFFRLLHTLAPRGKEVPTRSRCGATTCRASDMTFAPFSHWRPTNWPRRCYWVCSRDPWPTSLEGTPPARPHMQDSTSSGEASLRNDVMQLWILIRLNLSLSLSLSHTGRTFYLSSPLSCHYSLNYSDTKPMATTVDVILPKSHSSIAAATNYWTSWR